MLYQIIDGTVAAGGRTILSHVNFEIHGTEKIAVVGKNGAGKTTLLKLIAGMLELERDDRRGGPGITGSRKAAIGMLGQQAFYDLNRTVEEVLLDGCPYRDTTDRERFYYEKEYDCLFTGFGFAREDKKKTLASFSGGEQTKIGLIRLLLEKPDILLLDEPTNHLDMETVQWLEEYLRRYEKAVVMVSHDRFFLDRVADVVYEVAGGRLVRYPGNYTQYRCEKRKLIESQRKAYERQQEELARLNGLVERFKHKPTKASFARAKKKAMERMERIPEPESDDVRLFTGEITPLIPGSKKVFEAEHLKIGYGRPLLELSINIRKGQKIGLIGSNGAGKTTFLKTVAGYLKALGGESSYGNNITIGYFDQNSAAVESELSVADHFHELFPVLTDKEVRSVLGNYLFGGREASKRVSDLSGGEKARLVLAELLQSRPNFLVLDEPTNHMDIQAKETLESAFRSYKGTILVVSHDRYFIKQVAESILIFEGQSAMYYPFGYEHYLERSRQLEEGESLPARMKAEEQALIAGLKAVPKAERHRLREIPAEDAYRDWRLRLALEKTEAAGDAAMAFFRNMESTASEWKQTEACLLGHPLGDDRLREFEEMKQDYEACIMEWTDRCLEWYDIYTENKAGWFAEFMGGKYDRNGE